MARVTFARTHARVKRVGATRHLCYYSGMASRPIRILHVFGRMGMGGAEMWMMNVLRNLDRERYRCDFMVHQRNPGEFDDEIRALGSAVHVVDSIRSPARYTRDLHRLVKAGQYDIVHTHVSLFSGYIVSLARGFGVSGRIAHSHTGGPGDDNSLGRRVYKRAMRACIRHNATLGLGCSALACDNLFGAAWQRRGERVQRLPYGYDFRRFEVVGPATRERARHALGVGDDDLVIGHIGRFSRPKNHSFMVELMAASRAAGRVRDRFVFVGAGELQADFQAAVEARGLADKCIETGLRSDIPELLSSFDVLILPSLWEGLPVTILEAQAAGVPCVMSDRVSAETILLRDAVERVALGDTRPWLAAIDALAARDTPTPAEALARMRASDFDIDVHIQRVQAHYERQARR